MQMVLLIEYDIVDYYEGYCWMSEGSLCQDKDIIFHLSSVFTPCSTLDEKGIQIDNIKRGRTLL